MKLLIGADHRGFKLKEKIKEQKEKVAHGSEMRMIDVGADKLDPDDNYPKFAAAVAKEVTQNPDINRGIVICGTGVGVDIVANRFPRIRCALAISSQQIQAARQEDDVNILALAADSVSEEEALAMIEVFLKTEFSGEQRHRRRIAQIEDLKMG